MCLESQWILLGSDRGGSVAVCVVNQSVEGLIHPLPEHHSRNCPGNKRYETSKESVNLYEVAKCSSSLPVELEHEAGDGHASRHLEGHAADEIHSVSCVWVEG